MLIPEPICDGPETWVIRVTARSGVNPESTPESKEDGRVRIGFWVGAGVGVGVGASAACTSAASARRPSLVRDAVNGVSVFQPGIKFAASSGSKRTNGELQTAKFVSQGS